MAMRLTEAHQKKLFRHIREKWGDDRQCPMCHQHKWTVDASVYRLAALSHDPSAPHSVVQPLASVRCANCSFIALIHLTQSGIADPEELALGVPQQPATVPHVESQPNEIPAATHDGETDENEKTR